MFMVAGSVTLDGFSMKYMLREASVSSWKKLEMIYVPGERITESVFE
jgi:hypothetical protein